MGTRPALNTVGSSSSSCCFLLTTLATLGAWLAMIVGPPEPNEGPDTPEAEAHFFAPDDPTKRQNIYQVHSTKVINNNILTFTGTALFSGIFAWDLFLVWSAFASSKGTNATWLALWRHQSKTEVDAWFAQTKIIK